MAEVDQRIEEIEGRQADFYGGTPIGVLTRDIDWLLTELKQSRADAQRLRAALESSQAAFENILDNFPEAEARRAGQVVLTALCRGSLKEIKAALEAATPVGGKMAGLDILGRDSVRRGPWGSKSAEEEASNDTQETAHD